VSGRGGVVGVVAWRVVVVVVVVVVVLVRCCGGIR
jgi:hypothetical protein